MPGDNVVMSMLGNGEGGLGAGFLVLDAQSFEIKGRWESDGAPEWGYDFWYQPRKNTLISSEWAAPEVFFPGFDLEEVAAGKYGYSIHFWVKGAFIRFPPLSWAFGNLVPRVAMELGNRELGLVGA